MVMIPGLVLEPARNLRHQGPETAAQFERPAPTSVAYRISGTLYTDTLAANMVAIVWGSSSTVVDMTVANYVTFIVPVLGGVATLRIIAEADWAALRASENVVPLDYCWLQGMRYYQPRQGQQGPLGDWLTGALSGAGLTLYMSAPGEATPNASGIMGWFMYPSIPASTTTIMQVDSDSGGGHYRYIQVEITADGHIQANYRYDDNGSIVATVSGVDIFDGTLLTPDTLYWYWVAPHTANNNEISGITPPWVGLMGILWDVVAGIVHGGDAISPCSASVGTTSTGASVGMGKTLRGGNADWPDTAGWLLSGQQVMHRNTTILQVVPPPLTSPLSGGQDAAYLLIPEPIGATSTLPDDSGHSVALTTGTAHVVAGSPYPYTPGTIPTATLIVGDPSGTNNLDTSTLPWPASTSAVTNLETSTPGGMAVDGSGLIYIAWDNVIYSLSGGTLTHVAGDRISDTLSSTGDGGLATACTLSLPAGLCCDASGNLLITENVSGKLRKIDGSGNITTLYISPAAPGVAQPYDVCVDSGGNVYVAYAGLNQVYKNNAVWCGTGTASSTGDGGVPGAATINGPVGVAADSSDNIYISEGNGNRVRRVDAGTGFISTVMGNGTASSTGDGGLATSATINVPSQIICNGLDVYVIDFAGNKIRVIKQSSGIVYTVAGSASPFGLDAPATNMIGYASIPTLCNFIRPSDIALNPANGQLIANTGSGFAWSFPTI